VEAYRLQGRGGSGVINIDASSRNGDVVGLKAVCDGDELMLITEKGILIRTRVEEIRETGRNAQGVRLIKIDEGDRLVAMAKIDKDDVTTTTAAAEPEAPGEGEAPAAPPGDGSPGGNGTGS
jgi:DNA gyrase subunit A